MTDMRAWVGCLGCYNEGRLNGEWLDATDCDDLPAHLPTAEHATYSGIEGGGTYVRCTRCGSDEWWCFDTELAPFETGECSPQRAYEVGVLFDVIDSDADVETGAVLAWIGGMEPEITEWDAPTKMEFEDAYRGDWASFREYADDWAEQQIACARTEARAGDMRLMGGYRQNASEDHFEWVARYFDWDMHARDLEHDYTVVKHDGGVYIFWATS